MLTNPVIGSYRPEPGLARERVLSDEELSEIWRAAGEHGGDVAPIVRLLILTGQRREEIGELRWSEVDVPNLRLDLSGARTKNGRPHLVPLAPPMLETIRALARPRGEDGQIRDLLFEIEAAASLAGATPSSRSTSALRAAMRKRQVRRSRSDRDLQQGGVLGSARGAGTPLGRARHEHCQ